MNTRVKSRHTSVLIGLVVLAGCGADGGSAYVPPESPPAAIALVSLTSSGDQSSSSSFNAAINADGRYVAFESRDNNLTRLVGPPSYLYLRDTDSDATDQVSVSSSGTQANADSGGMSISADGRYVAFDSTATNLVTGDDNGVRDVFVHDRQTGTTERVSVASGGAQASGDSFVPSISADGRYVAFLSGAVDMVANDTNLATDVFVHDRQTGVTTRVSVDSAGNEADGYSDSHSISADGRYVAFGSDARNLVDGDTNTRTDVFVHDRQTGVTTRESVDSNGGEANGDSRNPRISADGRYVVFESYATDLVADDLNSAVDIFVRDTSTGNTARVSVAADGSEANAGSGGAVISADGRYVAFHSWATNLVAADYNDAYDVFRAPNLLWSGP